MQLQRKSIVLRPRPDVPWEAGGVFNAAVARLPSTGVFHMLYRALTTGFQTTTIRGIDAHHSGFTSSIGHATSADGITWQADVEPWLAPGDDKPWCAYGVEDPRISVLDDTYYAHYTAVEEEPYLGLLVTDDRFKVKYADKLDKADNYVHIALAVTNDFEELTDFGVVGPPSNSKAAALFPRRINGKIGLLSTAEIVPNVSSIVCVFVDDVEELQGYDANVWVDAVPLLEGELKGSVEEIGPSGFEIGAPPIETDAGWLLIISEITDATLWTIGAILLDRDDPSKVTHRLPSPILVPETPEEINGRVNNVCFPESALINGEDLWVYYGAGDQVVSLATCNLAELLDNLKQHPTDSMDI